MITIPTPPNNNFPKSTFNFKIKNKEVDNVCTAWNYEIGSPFGDYNTVSKREKGKR